MILSLNNDQTSQRDANFSVRPTLLYDVVVMKYTHAEFSEVITSITLNNEAFNGQPILGRFATFCQCLSLQNGQTMAIYAVFAIWTTPSPWLGVRQYKKPRICPLFHSISCFHGVKYGVNSCFLVKKS